MPEIISIRNFPRLFGSGRFSFQPRCGLRSKENFPPHTRIINICFGILIWSFMQSGIRGFCKVSTQTLKEFEARYLNKAHSSWVKARLCQESWMFFALPGKMPEMLELMPSKTNYINLACIIYAYTIYAAIFSNISNSLLAFQFAQIDFITHGHKSLGAKRTWKSI